MAYRKFVDLPIEQWWCSIVFDMFTGRTLVFNISGKEKKII